MVQERKVNKFYLSAAFGVSLSTVACPFVYSPDCASPSLRSRYYLGQDDFLYLLGGAYVGLVAACGFKERRDTQGAPKIRRGENSCSGRVPLDELGIDLLDISASSLVELTKIRESVSLTNNL